MNRTTANPLYVFEVLKKICTLKQHQRRVNLLREYSNYEMHTILLANFNPALVFDLPEGAPPYEADDTAPDRTRSTMRNTCKQFPFLLKGNSIPAIKKESIFKTMLEGVYSEDAKVIIAAKDKKLTELFPEVTEELVREAIPNLLPAVKK